MADTAARWPAPGLISRTRSRRDPDDVRAPDSVVRRLDRPESLYRNDKQMRVAAFVHMRGA